MISLKINKGLLFSLFVALALNSCKTPKEDGEKGTFPNLNPRIYEELPERPPTWYLVEFRNSYPVELHQEFERLGIDTSSLEGKRKWVMERYCFSNHCTGRDSVLDLNYDGYKDYIIKEYGLSGVGFKNLVTVYIYDSKKKYYCLDDTLSSLCNPTFYIKKKKITAFYIGLGGGDASQLEWIDGAWRTTKIINVSCDRENPDKEKVLWYIKYPLTNKRDSVALPYSMIPPSEILETDIDE